MAADAAPRGPWAKFLDAARTVHDLAGPHWSMLVRGLLLRVPQALCSALQVGLAVVVIDRVRADELTVSGAWLVAGLMVASIAVQLAFALASNRLMWITCYRFGGYLRTRLLEHTRRLPLSFHSARRTGDTATALTTDVSTVEDYIGWSLPSVFGDLVLPVAVLAVLVVVDPPMALAVAVSVIAAVPALGWTQRRYAAFTDGYLDLQAQTSVSVSVSVIEYVPGIGVIRAFNLAGARLHSFRATLDDLRSLTHRLLRMVTPTYVVFTTVLQLGIALTISATAYWLANGRIDAGTAIIFLVLAVLVYEPLFDISTRAESVPMVAATLRRISAVLDADEQTFPDDPRPVEQFHLAFQDVHFGYGAQPASPT